MSSFVELAFGINFASSLYEGMYKWFNGHLDCVLESNLKKLESLEYPNIKVKQRIVTTFDKLKDKTEGIHLFLRKKIRIVSLLFGVACLAALYFGLVDQLGRAAIFFLLPSAAYVLFSLFLSGVFHLLVVIRLAIIRWHLGWLKKLGAPNPEEIEAIDICDRSKDK